MAARLTFRNTRYGDIAAIWPRLEPIEVVELTANGHGPKRGLRAAIRCSIMCWTGELDGRPEAVFGVAATDLSQGIGRPWMLRTVAASGAGRAWLKDAPRFLAHIEQVFPRLENEVHVDNVQSIAWLERLGFAVEPDVVLIGGVPMRRFHRGF